MSDDDELSSLGSFARLIRNIADAATYPVGPIGQLQAALAREARLPKRGGLIGAGYARYMAEGQGGAQGNDAPAVLDTSLAGPDDGAVLIDVGNPHTPRLRREWMKAEGQDWPTDENGRRHDVAHIKALADGGTNTLDNIKPMSRADHIAEHIANGDPARFARRQWIAKAFGGRVARGIPHFDPSIITGILSGRLRVDKPENFISDMFGMPSPDDQRDFYERYQRAIDPDRKPGDLAV